MRERLAFSEKIIPGALTAMRQIEGLRECFLISTCNRVELYGRGDETIGRALYAFLASYHGVPETELCSYRYLLRGDQVIAHLFRLSCGLESMVIGESEIYGQLKRAFHTAVEAKSLDSILYQLVERALRVGKKARTETAISRGAVSVSSVAVELAEKIFGKLSGEQVLVLGTGEMSERTIENLVKAGAGKIVVSSRSFERALGLAQKFGAEPIQFDEWLRALRTSDIVISSTSAPHTVVRYEDVKTAMQERRHKPLFFIDIAVPRDVDASVQTLDDVYLYNIDDLQSVVRANVLERKREIEKCERLVEREITDFLGWLEQLDIKPTLEWFQDYYDSIVEEEIRKAPHPFQGKEEDLRGMLTRIRKKLFHRPLKNLKHASKEGTLHRYLQMVHELFSDRDRAAGSGQDAKREKKEKLPL